MYLSSLSSMPPATTSSSQDRNKPTLRASHSHEVSPLAPSAHPSLLSHDYQKAWEEWAIEPVEGQGEQRQQAILRMQDCLERKSFSLNLSGLNLSSLPMLPDHIQLLEVARNQLRCFPDVLPSSLEYFDASHNQIKNLPTHANALPASLLALDVRGNKINFIPDNLANRLPILLTNSTSPSFAQLPPYRPAQDYPPPAQQFCFSSYPSYTFARPPAPPAHPLQRQEYCHSDHQAITNITINAPVTINQYLPPPSHRLGPLHNAHPMGEGSHYQLPPIQAEPHVQSADVQHAACSNEPPTKRLRGEDRYAGRATQSSSLPHQSDAVAIHSAGRVPSSDLEFRLPDSSSRNGSAAHSLLTSEDCVQVFTQVSTAAQTLLNNGWSNDEIVKVAKYPAGQLTLNVLAATNETGLTAWQRLIELEFTHLELVNMASHRSAGSALSFLLNNHGRLLALGYSHAELAKIASYIGARNVLSFLLETAPGQNKDNHSRLHEDLRYSHAEIVAMAGKHGATQIFLFLLNNRDTLLALGYSPAELARITKYNGAAQTLPLLLSNHDRLLALGYSPAELARIASHNSAVQTLLLLLNNHDKLLALGYSHAQIVNMASHYFARPALSYLLETASGQGKYPSQTA